MPRRERIRVQTQITGESMTEQDHRQRTNINSIMTKYNMTGVLPSNKHPGMYGDFTGAVDYHTAMNKCIDAREEFASLPSTVRKRFHNDVGELLEFLSDDENKKEAMELGLIPKPEPQTLDVGEPVPPPKIAPPVSDNTVAEAAVETTTETNVN